MVTSVGETPPAAPAAQPPAEGMWVTPLPVEHGRDYTSLGFAFGVGSAGGAFIYISDVSTIYTETMSWLQRTKIAVLVLDGMLWDMPRPS